MATKYVVASLPRSGTRSLNRMAALVGLAQKHVSYSWRTDFQDFDLFSDTPFFAPSVLEELAAFRGVDVRFIYIERTPEEWFSSFERVGLAATFRHLCVTDDQHLHPGQQFDKRYYTDALGPDPLDASSGVVAYRAHRARVFDIARTHNRPLFSYSFSMGWAPLCRFLGVPTPDVAIPHLNRTSMFDAI